MGARFALIAAHDEGDNRAVIGAFATMAAARDAVARLDDSGEWPDGHDAHLHDTHTDQWFYLDGDSDEWLPLDGEE